MNAQKNTKQTSKAYRVDTNAPGYDISSSIRETIENQITPGTLNENSNFSERINDTAHVKEDRVSTGTNGEISASKETRNNPTRSVIHWGDREYDIDEFRRLLLDGSFRRGERS